MTRYDRSYGALLGLALGDAVGFPALFHRIHGLPERRRQFIWNTNRELTLQGVNRLVLPFTHRLAPETVEPTPTDDTEWALLSARALLDAPDEAPSQAVFLAAWQRYVLASPAPVITGFSERAAIDNLRRGLLPPHTGNDNPQHYDDSAAIRAVVSGLRYAGDPEAAADLAQADAEITNAEDGIIAARAVAAAIAVLAGGGALSSALAAARAEFLPDTWISYNDERARACLAEATSPLDLALHLTRRVINTVYSFGNVAPETVPAALVICAATDGNLTQAVLLANAIPKAADSLPALVGALCGALHGPQAIPPAWQAALNTTRGTCLPALAGLQLDTIARGLASP